MSEILPSERMWRTLVRVEQVGLDMVWLVVPGVDAEKLWLCPRQAVPPAIYKTMEHGKHYHVECNIGALEDQPLCFDRWETS